VRRSLAGTVAGTDRKADFHVVGIGASAGGAEALRTLFSGMPASPGFACVVVVHLSPEHESHLVQLLQPSTQMPVCQVTCTTVLEPNRVYVIPPNANLNSIDTHLRLSELETRRAERAPIDHFLRTLAETHGETAIGVILSGSGSDGALGIRQIKAHGGLTIAQSPRESEFASMPHSAIATGTVDLVLSLEQIPAELTGYCAIHPAVSAPGEDDVLPAEESAFLEKLFGEVRLRTGQEFARFKPAVVLQRVRHRMRLRRASKLTDYFGVLRDHPDEPRALYHDLLLHVTEFFSDTTTYATLEQAVREIIDRKDERSVRVRVWSIGCSTGEEAYSLAMLLVEQASRRGMQLQLQVFASELSAKALQQAREGIYPQEVAATISPERLERFFVHENGRYRVRGELRDIVTFATHDLFQDPPFAHLDLIVCHSLLPDLRAEMRSVALNLFYYSLEPNGILWIDTADEIDATELFTRESATPQLLRRSGGPMRVVSLPPEVNPFARLSGENRGLPVAPPCSDYASVFRSAIEHYAPPSLLIDAASQVVHFSPTAARYVRIPGGELTVDIVKLVPQTIAVRLREGLRQVHEGLDSWRSAPFAIAAEGVVRRMVVRVDRADRPGPAGELLLVVFDDQIPWRESAEAGDGGEAPREIAKLESELARAAAQVTALSNLTSDVSGQSQESQVLQTVVQELEEAREELQAVNEELLSLNAENQYRLEALAQMSNDLQHLLNSTGLATLLVDNSLNVVRFTPLLSDIFRLRSTDVGRPLQELKHQLRYADLLADVQRVIRDLSEVELEAETEDGRWFLVRIQPYRSALRGVEGAVLVLIDISGRKRAEIELREADRRKDEFIAVLAHELRNPLAPIGAGIEVLRSVPDDRALVQQVTATMARQTQQLVRLVDDLLEVSRISGGKLTLRVTHVAIAEVVHDAVAAVRPFIDALEHQLTVAVPEEPLFVEGDAARLTQVVANLLHNAGRYTPTRGQIALAVCRVGEEVSISVRDNGVGIAPQALPDVFEMFYQASDTAALNSSGLGIGLTLAKKLVEMHGGAISAESSGLNAGSTFTVRLPLAHAVGTALPGARLQVTASPPGSNRVLIVDDNVDAAETMRLLMTTLGSGEVRTASNGAEALAVGAQLHPDVVLLDLGMPGMDGYEVARRMRNQSWGKDALLVALTGWGQEQYRHRAREAGFDRHMTKPADPEALRAMLKRAHAH
jgi:two-component system, chemotaxis family, CheB/CheR fusion protein